MDAELIAYLDRKFDAIGARIDVFETRLRARMDRLAECVGRPEERLDAGER